MNDRQSLASGPRRLVLGALAALLVCGALLWLFVGRPNAPEVCDTTVYEGCPARWDYLLEDDG